MNSRQVRTSTTRIVIGAALLTLFAMSVAVGLWRISASASQLSTLSDATLHEKGLALAQSLGLKGKPRAEKMTRMTLAEAGNLIDAELGKDAGQFGLTPDMPVFVYTLRGNVEPTGPIEYPPNQPVPKYDRMLLVLNAHNGGPLIWGYYHVGKPLPQAVELP